MTFGRGLRALSIASVVLICGAFALVFFYAPNDADQGFVQKIFYVHVPMAIVALCGFVAGGIYGIKHLRSGDRADDLRSYVAIHISLVLAVGVLITGSIWARAAWGQWWVWDEPTLVSFLIVFLLYACYQPLRFSIEDPERQARYASVFAIVCGAFVPLNFMAVRMAESLVHPRVLGTTGGSMPGDMRLTFLVALAGMACLFVTLWKYELASKSASIQLRSLKRRLAGDDGLAPLQRSAAPQQLYDARPPARRRRPVRRGRLPGLPRVDPDLRGDHGDEARADRARDHRAVARSWSGARPRASRRRSGCERAAAARHVAQDRAAGGARARRAHRGPRRGVPARAGRPPGDPRGGRALDLQPHRALRRRRATRSRPRRPCWGCSRARPACARPS